MARLRSCFHKCPMHLKFLHCSQKKPRFSRQVCDLMEPPPAWALHGMVKIGSHGRRSDEWHNDQLGDIQKFRELRNSRCQRLGDVGRMENRRFLMIFVCMPPLCPVVVGGLASYQKGLMLPLSPRALGQVAICFPQPRHVASLIFTRLHAPDNKWNVPVN